MRITDHQKFRLAVYLKFGIISIYKLFQGGVFQGED
jgi:hypothetical protein